MQNYCYWQGDLLTELGSFAYKLGSAYDLLASRTVEKLLAWVLTTRSLWKLPSCTKILLVWHSSVLSNISGWKSEVQLVVLEQGLTKGKQRDLDLEQLKIPDCGTFFFRTTVLLVSLLYKLELDVWNGESKSNQPAFSSSKMKLQVLCAKYLGDTIPEKLILISFSYHYHVRLRNILYRAAYESERLIRGLYNTLISHVANRVNIRGSEKRPSSSCYLRDERKKKRDEKPVW